MSKGAKIEKIRHSLAHLLAMAVLEKFPKAKLGIGPVIENGFYYDFDLPKPLSVEDLPGLEKKMAELAKKDLRFKKSTASLAEAKKLFKHQLFKLDLIKEFVKNKKRLTIYETSSPKTSKLRLRRGLGRQVKAQSYLTDLCAGPHVASTKEINPEAFKLTKIAGAYWRGNEKNPMLTRVYGVAFETKKELAVHLKMLEEAEKRDHKKLGPALDLFTFSEVVGSGLPLWTPKGTIIRDELDSFVWELRKKHGYERVDIPHLTKKDLYEISGHWEKFQNELFKINTREGHLFVVKPMNCPHHIQIYTRRKWSCRELPQRYATTTKVYRDEQSGELSGLSRVRAITQDDAHVFCRKSQMEPEIEKVWNIIENFYRAAGFSLRIRLSLRNPKQPKKYLGTPKHWSETEGELRKILKKHGVKFIEAAGEAAFYGPKIDFLAKDSLGREWQVATIQLDMNMPERFDLSCTDEKGQPERIVMIHAAIMGAIERYISVLIEHFAGAFPVWLAPVQAKILPVSDKFNDYARKVLEKLRNAGIRAEMDESNETLNKKIRNAQLEKIPYMLVVGEKEKNTGTVAERGRSGKDYGQIKVENFILNIRKEIEDKTL